MIRNCILTERLVLRPFVDGDEEDVLALMSDDYICRMAGIKPFKTLAEARRFMDNWAGEAYAITERDSDTVIGIIQTWCDEILLHVYVGNEASRNVALKCGLRPKYEAYKDCIYNPYGRAESEECFSMTRGDYEWERRGEPFYSTAA